VIGSGARALLAALYRDSRGTMVIETAIVAPVLVLLSLGAFEASSIVSRQSELQSAAAEAVAIVMAATPETQAQIDEIEAAVENSSGIAAEDVTFSIKIRCGTSETLVDRDSLDADSTVCGNQDLQSWFLLISMTDTYSPAWTDFGIGSDVVYEVERMVQLQ
jgi:Flp pilus assembly protein TadG